MLPGSPGWGVLEAPTVGGEGGLEALSFLFSTFFQLYPKSNTIYRDNTIYRREEGGRNLNSRREKMGRREEARTQVVLRQDGRSEPQGRHGPAVGLSHKGASQPPHDI